MPPPADTPGLVLDALRARTGRPDLDYAVPPTPLSGGFWAEIFSIRLADPPPELAGDLVLRVMPDARVAQKEIVVQSGVVAQGFPAPAIRLAAEAGSPLSRAFMVMDRASGAPLLGGLSATGVVADLPRLARRLPVLLADTSAALHAIDPAPIRHRLAAAGSAAPTDVTGFLEALTAYAGDLGRPDLAGAGHRLAELRPADGDEVICHGDLHPFNLLVDGDRVTVIDWTTALVAEPAYDVAFTWLLLVDAPLHVPGPLRAPLHLVTGRVAGAFLRRYRSRARIPVPDAALRWHVGLHCLRALVEAAGWVQAGELEAHLGHPWLISGGAFAVRLQRLTGIPIGFPSR
jgi:aminoglycoside phosphotransferase (APT) family kinase protein